MCEGGTCDTPHRPQAWSRLSRACRNARRPCALQVPSTPPLDDCFAPIPARVAVLTRPQTRRGTQRGRSSWRQKSRNNSSRRQNGADLHHDRSGGFHNVAQTLQRPVFGCTTNGRKSRAWQVKPRECPATSSPCTCRKEYRTEGQQLTQQTADVAQVSPSFVENLTTLVPLRQTTRGFG